MALALNSSHALASAVTALIAVDGNTGSLVDLKTARTFTVDAGVTFIDDATNGKVLRTAGADASSAKGFSFTPAVTMATQVAGFGSTIFLVLAKHAGDDGGLANYKNNSPVGGNVMIYHPLPTFTHSTYGRKIALSSVNTDTYDAAKTSNISIYGDGQRHTIATTASNPAGGWNSVAGKLFVDGTDTGIAVTGAAGDATIGAFNNLNNNLWRGDFLYMAIFNRALTPAEIAGLHASVGNNNAFGLVTGQPAGAAAPTGTVTIGTVTPASTSASVPYSYSGSDATGYQYRLNGGTATALGASPATISGLTASTAYTLEVRATNATGNGAWSAVSNFTTAAPAGDTTAPTLSGVPSFSAITSSGYTVTWTAGTDAVGVTGYEVQVASGGWTNVGNVLTTAIAGRTAGATETVQVRAYDAAGNRSAAISANVTLASAVVTGTITVTEPLKNNTGTLRASLTGIKAVVLRASDMVAVLTKTGLTTNASGLLSAISDANIVAGTQYHVVIKLSDGGVGVSAPIAAA